MLQNTWNASFFVPRFGSIQYNPIEVVSEWMVFTDQRNKSLEYKPSLSAGFALCISLQVRPAVVLSAPNGCRMLSISFLIA